MPKLAYMGQVALPLRIFSRLVTVLGSIGSLLWAVTGSASAEGSVGASAGAGVGSACGAGGSGVGSLGAVV